MKINAPCWIFACVGLLGAPPAAAEVKSPFTPVASWEFASGLQGWEANSAIARAASGKEGLAFESTGGDPWLTSPPFKPPPGRALRIRFRMKSAGDGNGQLFFGRTFSEENSMRFSVKADGSWSEYTLTIPAQPAGARLRLDPSTDRGRMTLAWVRVESIEPIQAPALKPPEPPLRGDAPAARLASGPLELEHGGKRWGGFILKVAGVEVAASHDAGVLGYYDASRLAWKELAGLPAKVALANGLMTEEVSFTDAGGARWTLRRKFKPGKIAGCIEAETSIACDRARHLLHVPWMTLFPGLGTTGGKKHQAIFAGLEYLADEPSSSQADLTSPEHTRIVPDPSKITFPLMAIESAGRCIGLTWEPSPLAAAVFDSPDRVFGSGSHLLALWAPAAGALRMENSLFAHSPFPIEPGAPIVCRAALLGGEGGSAIPAVQQYVALRGLPKLPIFPGGLQAAERLLAAGWIESGASAGDGKWRHAVWPGFNAQPASDAIIFMLRLAAGAPAEIAGRLRKAAEQAIEKRKIDDPAFQTGVSHIQWPINALLLGNVAAYAAARRDAALAQLGTFDAQGLRAFSRNGGKANLGATHFADHANGFGATALQGILEAAAFSGSDELSARALDLLDRQAGLYRNTEPRGAQTWEVPLHTPDILASAYMLKCYVLGYELSGKAEYLEEARYWAWTGVPFIYLEPSTAAEVSRFATTPVFGATQFKAPVWIGLPVQWCGLVYRSWLHRLAIHDPSGPWETLARGITICGLQMSWPRTDAARAGLLPDFYDLRGQSRAGPAINPGTVQAGLTEAFGAGSLYGFRRAEKLGWLIHAPGAIEGFESSPDGVSFSVRGWGPDVFRVLAARVAAQPAKVLSRKAGSNAAFAGAPFTFDPANRCLVIEAKGDVELRIEAR